ncbi:MAG: F0F1 ATP synthase subunit delta [Fervidobacterium sp.]
MIYSALASKYAVALYNVSKRNGKTEEYKNLLQNLADIYEPLSTYLNNQALKPEKRVQVILEVMRTLGIEVDEVFQKFMYILIANKRIKYIKQIVSFFEYTILDESGLIPVNLTSATSLSAEEEALLSEFVNKYTGRKPVFKVNIDEELLAGVIIEFAGKTFDVSLKGRLNNIARNVLIKGKG